MDRSVPWLVCLLHGRDCACSELVDCVWNVMAHAQKPDLVFRRNGRVHLNRRGRQFSRLLATEVCASAVVMLDTACSEVVWRELATHSIRQFPLHFPSRASPCAITFQLDYTNWAWGVAAVYSWGRVLVWVWFGNLEAWLIPGTGFQTAEYAELVLLIVSLHCLPPSVGTRGPPLITFCNPHVQEYHFKDHNKNSLST